MSKHSKKQKVVRQNLEIGKQHPILEAVDSVKKCATAKFDESFDVAIVLGVDASKSDQGVRGATVLPNGTGKSVRVAVFAQGDQADKAKAAGADIVGFDDLAEKVKSGDFAADVVIATPDSMRIVGQLGQILGPRGLMPNPKVGTVSNDVAMAVKNAKGGQVRYRTDKNGIIHCSIGKASFNNDAIKQNLEALLQDLKKAKPATAKGTYLRKISVSSTMGPAFAVDIASLNV
ncbi:MAG: 50S ribosomal protein L1 [Gammaproteobacteria bacterium CG_4_10_14_0_8_um_filter_38_16]|nr:MAG: 50S ribosomal protein L1 [Gammaproteobacteria bacterium CG_4_10_14_0_8_um_filter_38_16]PJA02751.1 MAG: 50S ribosomal protein L1 [Gammaproteobacteria bacterium CG_4_10_14_0_2_um_filter_38_22]PJB10505.1 MAG: 50S ribosomal protein L1 [Gammaproteobacteria bacterium CG_4_9_14_3_um_filter_38_9]